MHSETVRVGRNAAAVDSEFVDTAIEKGVTHVTNAKDIQAQFWASKET